MKNAKTPSLNTTDPLPQNLKSLLSQTRFEKMVFFQRPAKDSFLFPSKKARLLVFGTAERE
jgi:hypothetical protein